MSRFALLALVCPYGGFGAEPTRLPHTGAVYGVVYSADGRQVITAGQDGRVHCWDAASGRNVRSWAAHQNGVLALALSADGKTLASGGRDACVRIWDVATGKERRKLTGLIGDVEGLALSSDGRTLAASSSGTTGGFRTPRERNVFG